MPCVTLSPMACSLAAAVWRGPHGSQRSRAATSETRQRRCADDFSRSIVLGNRAIHLTSPKQRHAFRRGVPTRLRLHDATARGHAPRRPLHRADASGARRRAGAGYAAPCSPLGRTLPGQDGRPAVLRTPATIHLGISPDHQPRGSHGSRAPCATFDGRCTYPAAHRSRHVFARLRGEPRADGNHAPLDSVDRKTCVLRQLAPRRAVGNDKPHTKCVLFAPPAAVRWANSHL